MTSEAFIAELERRRHLSDRLLGKLRDLLAEQDRPYTPEEVADFLVSKNHLTRDQADSILQSIAGSGVHLFQWIKDVDAYHKELVARGAEIASGPTDQPYGIRELAIRDVNGVGVVFGQDIEHD